MICKNILKHLSMLMIAYSPCEIREKIRIIRCNESWYVFCFCCSYLTCNFDKIIEWKISRKEKNKFYENIEEESLLFPSYSKKVLMILQAAWIEIGCWPSKMVPEVISFPLPVMQHQLRLFPFNFYTEGICSVLSLWCHKCLLLVAPSA